MTVKKGIQGKTTVESDDEELGYTSETSKIVHFAKEFLSNINNDSKIFVSEKFDPNESIEN